MKLPYAEHAVVDIRKLRDYCLNPSHSDGKHKARLFQSQLGMTSGDAEQLRLLLLDVVLRTEAVLGRRDQFGQRYAIDLELTWHNKKAVIRSGWIIEHGSTKPRLTACYPL